MSFKRRVLACFAALSLAGAGCRPARQPTESSACGSKPDGRPECRAECGFTCGSLCADICGAFGCWQCDDDAWRFMSTDCERGCDGSDAGACDGGACDGGDPDGGVDVGSGDATVVDVGTSDANVVDLGACGPPDGSLIPECRPGCTGTPGGWCYDHCQYGCWSCATGQYAYSGFDCIGPPLDAGLTGDVDAGGGCGAPPDDGRTVCADRCVLDLCFTCPDDCFRGGCWACEGNTYVPRGEFCHLYCE